MAPLSLCLLPTSWLLLLSVLILLPRMQLSDLALGDLIQTEDFTSVEGICEWPSNLSPDLKHIMLSLEALGYLLDLSADISQSHHIWDKNLHFLLTLKNTKGWPFMWWKILTTCLGNKPFWKFYYDSQFTDDRTETQRSEKTCPGHTTTKQVEPCKSAMPHSLLTLRPSSKFPISHVVCAYKIETYRFISKLPQYLWQLASLV